MFHLCFEYCQAGGFHSLAGYPCQHPTTLIVKNAFQISSQEFPCCSLSVVHPRAHISAQPQPVPVPREMSNARGGAAPCAPQLPFSWVLAARTCPADWRWRRYPAPSSPPSKRFCLICTSMQQRTSGLQALLQSPPLAMSLCSSVQARGQIHISSKTSMDPSGVGFYQLLPAPMQFVVCIGSLQSIGDHV